ncbi:hypothetical protein PHYSODRAFT_328705 [Phytophthora sojae]|uniref:Uncharacterized protein n=1 Tax=Phytophthora sojae (strain P6497) TaxID=1094619 RepID=G4ZAX3_PHYSP|nr:hypothetical protein PHYSODRAFT_328705 [Phytophthora sojae]EGZ20601.1 hypothetical protein PHYSODRAFT_328705 [Phytophthora sojae]|eukprot:XP_009523318.1 hypothetical protein PHYSODRAFT_328705 [Phytophthora sojae]
MVVAREKTPRLGLALRAEYSKGQSTVGRKVKTGKGATFKATIYTRFDATRDDSVDLLPFELPPLEPPPKMSPMPGGAVRCHWGRSSYSAVLSLWPLRVILAVLPLEPFSMRHVHHPCDDVVYGQAGPLKTIAKTALHDEICVTEAALHTLRSASLRPFLIRSDRITEAVPHTPRLTLLRPFLTRPDSRY